MSINWALQQMQCTVAMVRVSGLFSIVRASRVKEVFKIIMLWKAVFQLSVLSSDASRAVRSISSANMRFQ